MTVWAGHAKTNKPSGDKDFKNLNKLMVRARGVNARDSTKFRQNNDMRINQREGTNQKRLRLPHEDHAYGKPLRRSSPMREVIGNYYGELAEGELIAKYDKMRDTRSQFHSTTRHGMRTMKHTQKSMVAASYVQHRQDDIKKRATLMQGSEDLFKMRKFKNVQPRTNTHNRRRPKTTMGRR